MSKTLKLFLGYIIFGGIAAVVDVGLLVIFTSLLGIWYFYSAIASYTIGMIVNYILNKYFNFQNKSRRIVLQFGIFASVAAVGLLLNQIILYVLVDLAGMWYLTAKFFALAVVMVWSFFGHKEITFGKLG